jgi:hypothetical protein
LAGKTGLTRGVGLSARKRSEGRASVLVRATRATQVGAGPGVRERGLRKGKLGWATGLGWVCFFTFPFLFPLLFYFLNSNQTKPI